jgi:hypothetical protein
LIKEVGTAMSRRPTEKAAATLYESEWWNRLAAISEKGISDKPVERFETTVERPGFFRMLSSMLDSLVGRRLTTSIVKMN